MHVQLIHYMKQHKYSHRGLITKTLSKNGVTLTGAEQVEGKVILKNNFLKLTHGEKWDEAKALKQKKEKQDKSRVRKAKRTVEKAPIVKKPRTIRPKAQKNINLELMMEEDVEDINEDNLNITKILKQSPHKPRKRLVKVAAKKGKSVEDLEASEKIIVAPTVVREGRKRGAGKSLEKIIE